jgi:flagellin
MDLSMIIQQTAFSVGSLTSADPNSQSFHSPDHQKSGAKKQAANDSILGDDTLTITLPTSHRGPVDSEECKLGEAISLHQTQGAFLHHVQEALERMTELSQLALAQPEGDRSTYAAEFAALQQRIKALGVKMYTAATTFLPLRLESRGAYDEASSFGNRVAWLVNESIQGTSNPTVTTIDDQETASAAAQMIQKTLKTVLEIQGRVETNLQSLKATGEQMTAPQPSGVSSKGDIANLRTANESTRSICDEILVKSGTAMLAQANALPECALQLLR